MTSPTSDDFFFTVVDLAFIAQVLVENSNRFDLRELALAHDICMKIDKLASDEASASFLDRIGEEWNDKG